MKYDINISTLTCLRPGTVPIGSPFDLVHVMLGRGTVSREAAVAATLTNLYPRPGPGLGPPRWAAHGCL